MPDELFHHRHQRTTLKHQLRWGTQTEITELLLVLSIPQRIIFIRLDQSTINPCGLDHQYLNDLIHPNTQIHILRIVPQKALHQIDELLLILIELIIFTTIQHHFAKYALNFLFDILNELQIPRPDQWGQTLKSQNDPPRSVIMLQLLKFQPHALATRLPLPIDELNKPVFKRTYDPQSQMPEAIDGFNYYYI